MRVIAIGISDSAGQSVPPAPTYDELNTDWTTESAPTEFTLISGTLVYGPDGTYNTSHLDFSVDQVGTTTDVLFGTLIVAINPIGATDNYFGFILSEMQVHGTYDDDSDLLNFAWSYNDNNGSITSVDAAIGVPFAIGMTTDLIGNVKVYYIDENGTQVTTNSATPPIAEAGLAVSQMFPSADSGSTFGTAGDMVLTNTYYKVNDTLSQAAIEAIVSGWGIGP